MSKRKYTKERLKTRRNREKVTFRKTRHVNAYTAIKELSETHGDYPVSEMCRILGINRAAYYKWKNHGSSRNDSLNELIAEKSGAIHDKHPDMGYRRIRDTLAHDHGINVNDKRILSRSISANALSEVA